MKVCSRGGAGESGARMVRGLEWWWEKPGCPWGLRLRCPQPRQRDPALFPTLPGKTYRSLIFLISATTTIKSLNLWGRVQADAKFPSHAGCGRERSEVVLLCMRHTGLAGGPSAGHPFSLTLGCSSTKGGVGAAGSTRPPPFSQMGRGCEESTSQKEGHSKGPRQERELGGSKDLDQV